MLQGIHDKNGVKFNGTHIQYQKGWMHQHKLEGDGLLSLLYDQLYKTDETKEHHFVSAGIPDTVIFECALPRAWYSYSTKYHEITKKSNKELDIYQNI